MEEEHKKLLQKQHYYVTGDNSAVKICTWTKKSLKDMGECYKERFYGIRCHLCAQVSTTVGHCTNKCLICWRPMEYTETKDMESPDEPETIIENTIIGQQKLLSGLGGYAGLNKEKFKAAQDPMHYAISLTGEPFTYPKLGELIKTLHKKGKTTFVVTNGMFPEKLEGMEELPTQLYVSVDAPNKELFEQIDNPTIDNAWEKLLKTLDIVKNVKDKTRTTLRLTLIKDISMTDVDGWVDMINRADPTFIEVKAYMFVGYSRNRLKMENMPRHHEVKEFAEKICEKSDYKIIDEQSASRVVLLMKEDFEGRVMKFDD